MPVASIDIGTNTTLLLVAEVREGEPVATIERAEITRLGRGIGGDGLLREENVARTLDVLRGYADAARRAGVPDGTIRAVGTEALRRAPNAQTFLGPAAEILGAPVEVIGGEREAALTFLAATRSFPELAHGRLLVIDIGGGSTEFIAADAGKVVHRVSLPLGSVRLTEKHIAGDPARAEELLALTADVAGRLPESGLAQFVSEEGYPTLVGTAGTVTTLAAMSQNLETYDPNRVHGYALTNASLQKQMLRLEGSTQAERENFAGLDPRRADVILAGAKLLDGIVTWAGVQEVTVSDRGVRWGLIYEAVG